jgi:hypothetical protein
MKSITKSIPIIAVALALLFSALPRRSPPPQQKDPAR